MHKNPAYAQVVVTRSSVRTIYIRGQNAIDRNGAIIGKGDIKAQAEQILKNIKIALKASNATIDHIIKWNVYIVQGQPIQPAFEVFQKEIQTMPHPPLVTGLYVSGLANPDFLLEIEAIAAIAE